MGDVQGVGEFSLGGGHAAEGDVVLGMGKGSLGIDDGDFSNGGEFVEKRGKGKVESGVPGDLSREGGKQEREYAVQPVDLEFPVGPVIGGLPPKEVDVLHVLEGVFDLGEAAIGADEVVGVALGSKGEQEGASEVLLGEPVECGVIDGVVQGRRSFFLGHGDLEQFTHELGGQDGTHGGHRLRPSYETVAETDEAEAAQEGRRGMNEAETRSSRAARAFTTGRTTSRSMTS